MLIETFAAMHDGDWFRREGTLRWVFGATPTHIHAELLGLLEMPAAEVAYPTEVRRLRRLRDARRGARSAARAG